MVPVVCVVELVGGGGGATTPGLSVCPAITATARVRLRTVTAVIWRKVFTLMSLLVSCKNFAIFKRDKHDRSDKLLQEPDGLR